MGFWSSIGSAISSVASSVGSVVGSVTSAVGRGVSAAYNTVKVVAGKAIGWIAEKAEGFVAGVKNAWKAVKPYVDKVRITLRIMAHMAAGIPWLSGALIMLDLGLGALTAFENSPIAKKVEQAINWAIKIAKRWRGLEPTNEREQEKDRLNEAELEEAKKHQANLRFAEREIVTEEQRHQLELAAIFNDYEIASTDLANTIDNAPEDFEHYLRLRATQKLLVIADKKFRTAKTVDDISADDIFLVRIASDLIKSNPELSNEVAARLDRLLIEHHGKKLLPFVFEELIASWAKRAETLDKQWKLDNKAYAKESALYKFLLGAEAIQSELSEEESRQLATLKVDVPKQKEALDALATRQRDVERYVGAAEGLLQVFEKEEQQIIDEDREYLLEDAAHIGRLLIECAQTEVPFIQLSPEDKSKLTNYANIFKKESKKRMESLLELTA